MQSTSPKPINLTELVPEKKIGQYEWTFKAHLGSGAFGKVYLGHDTKTKALVAIKILDSAMINTNEQLKKSLENEISLMRPLKHKNIVGFVDCLMSTHNIQIITEYCNGGDLRAFMRKLNGPISEMKARQILADIIHGLSELQKHNIIHRDLKPENILIHDGIFKIADFGFAKSTSNPSSMQVSRVGTPLQMAPQILSSLKQGVKGDIWSLGIIFYEVLSGKLPWSGKTEVELHQKIKEEPLTFPFMIKISEVCIGFIKGCLQFDEDKSNIPQEIVQSPKSSIKLEMSKEPIKIGESQGNNINKKLKRQKSTVELESKARQIIQHLQKRIYKEQKIDLVKLFKYIDKNGSGDIDLSEFQILMQKIDKNISKDEVEYAFSIFDINKDGSITQEEFMRLIYETDYSAYNLYKDPFIEAKAGYVLKQLREIVLMKKLDIEILFKAYDKDKSNALDLNEFCSLVRNIDVDISDKEIEYLFTKFDEDNSGLITLDEFKKAIYLKHQK